tara:strand:- start:1322 stop:1507 length:186 start_codon:yes stop_codon:yes gene_type:complete
MKKYRWGLRNVIKKGNFITSNNKKIAEIKGDELHHLGWWSWTAAKHINHIAKELGLKPIQY